MGRMPHRDYMLWPGWDPGFGFLSHPALLQIGCNEEATEELHQSMDWNPQNVFPYTILEDYYMNLNRLEKAKATQEEIAP